MHASQVIALLALLAGLVCLVATVVAWRRRSAPAAMAFLAYTLSVSWWCLSSAYLAIRFPGTTPQDYNSVRISWVGIVLTATTLLIFVVQYVGAQDRWSWQWMLVLGLEAALTLAFIATNDWHHLMWQTSVTTLGDGTQIPIIAARGPWWYVHVVYAYILRAVVLIWLLIFLRQTHALYRRQVLLLVVAVCVPWFANFLFLLGTSGGEDLTAPAFAVSAVAFAVALFSQRLLDVMPLAQAEIFRSIANGIVVLDRQGRVLQVNPAAARLAGTAGPAGEPLEYAFPALAACLPTLRGDHGELVLPSDASPRTFAIDRSTLADGSGRVRGTVLLLTETTEEYRITELERSRQLTIEAQERLRQEIAEQLHGGVQTRLLLAGFRLTQARQTLRTDPDATEASLAQLSNELDSIRENDVRRVSHRLHPSVITIGLIPALESLIASQSPGLDIVLQASAELEVLDDPVDNQLPDEFRLAAYRIVEEALANVWRHAHATQVTIQLGVERAPGAELVLRVVDNGQGPDLDGRPMGLGLNTIGARAAYFGGSWRLTRVERGGAELCVRLPLSHPDGGLTPSPSRTGVA